MRNHDVEFFVGVGLAYVFGMIPVIAIVLQATSR
jgi:hypothetical protein